MVENPHCPLNRDEIIIIATSLVLSVECDDCKLGCLLKCLVVGECERIGMPPLRASGTFDWVKEKTRQEKEAS